MNQLPHHLGIILDGNRRWAEERDLPAFKGHQKGLETAKKIIKYCKEKGIKILTLFIFSTENWERRQEEVNYLMKLAQKAISNHLKHLGKKNQIRVRVIGQKERMPKLLQREITKIEKLTEGNREMTVNLALSYGGRAEIIEVVKKIIEKKIPSEKITEETIKENLCTSDVDLIIRTGKEQRISNFLIWQAAYSEFYFCPKYWPEFTEKDLDEALKEYAQRQRRFGK